MKREHQVMESYTYGSDEAIEATIAALPFKYPMELNREDMATIIRALVKLDESGEDGNAGSLAASIADTVGVEWV